MCSSDLESEDTDIGPLVSKSQLEKLMSQVDDAKEKGARLVVRGKVPEDMDGAYYPPTIIVDITRNMKVWKEEVFGPVLPVISFRTGDEVIELANDTEYGLGATIYSKDTDRAERVAEKIDAGSIEINNASRWSCVSIPYGGNKSSGMGREHGRDGFRELCRIKVVSL